MTEAITKPDATASLVPTKAELEGGGIVPTGAKNDGRAAYPYVGFYGAKTQETEALDAAGLEPYDFYLHDQYPIRLKPFECHVLRVGQFFTKVDNRGQPTAARLDCPDDAFKDKFRSHLFALVAVRQPTPTGIRFVPAVATFRSAQANCMRKAVALLTGAAATAEGWAARGPKEAEGAHAKTAGGRFVTTIWSEPKETDEGDMNNGFGIVRPTPKVEVDAFNAWWDANYPLIAAVAGVNNTRIAGCQKLLK